VCGDLFDAKEFLKGVYNFYFVNVDILELFTLLDLLCNQIYSVAKHHLFFRSSDTLNKHK